ncbi:serine protease 27-like [Seriola lalandi dorsalis]|uniref:Serine protease 27-like n=1 Tax=Seriola lalandi dorsalis TaxID=1841481 RepID=A0A3B4YGE0_SERLL|nr:serine protease 27-like [Seriola lalandi dorsalis]
MELKLLCAAVLSAFMVTGNNAQSSVCGTAPLNTKIVGGQSAVPGAWPWQASLYMNGIFFCGGSLINNQWVLTGAQCFPSTSTSGLVVYLGRDKQSVTTSPNQQSRSVTMVIKHPSYNSINFNNDIALVKLSSTVMFTNYIRPVCLAAADSIYKAGTKTWVTGWGYVQTNKPLPFPYSLQEVSVPVVSNSQCNKVYGGITSNMICAGVPSGGKDICFGDSGGPMVSKTGSRWVQGGVASFGSACAKPNAPGGYTRVSKYQAWINSHISTNQPGFVTFSGSSSVGAAAGVVLPVLLSLFVLS